MLAQFPDEYMCHCVLFLLRKNKYTSIEMKAKISNYIHFEGWLVTTRSFS